MTRTSFFLGLLYLVCTLWDGRFGFYSLGREETRPCEVTRVSLAESGVFGVWGLRRVFSLYNLKKKTNC